MSDALNYLVKARPEAMTAYFTFLKKSDTHLDTRTRDLISVITKVAVQTEGGFRQYLTRALRNGASPNEIIDALMMRFIESQVYQGVVENIACEMSARMIAMKSATDNAADLIKELQTVYNKARQAAITQEISEIVSGAAAV